MTALAASGSGSLREALEAEKPRIIVFEVGSVIDLERSGLLIASPQVTVVYNTLIDKALRK